ncbi:MAG: serine/threonine-protein kinase [Phycisphaerales bacterium]|nr:serine/threonine-protein kinase [Phycisphaerales bacterium]
MTPVKPFNPPRADAIDDDLLADAIEADGRELIERGVPVQLDRYLKAVPDLERREVPLDAALDIALRSAALARGATRPEAVDGDLVASAYPRLRGTIQDALSLDAGLLTTRQVRTPERMGPLAGLPRNFGPRLADGRERYTLNRLIGVGTSGTVYAAIDRHLSEPDRPAEVAIKVLAARRTNRWLARRLTEEATKARRVDHPSVVRVLDRGGEETDTPFIVYELVKGGDLQSWFEAHRKRVPVRKAVAIVAQIARGVQAAHAAGLVHSDLKPANVLLDERGEAKVADFGIAARLHRSLMEEAEAASADQTVGPVGNMAFISPEQFRAEPGCFSAPADVYALGGILYYLLTGGFPNGDSPADVARSHGDALKSATLRPASPREARRDVDGSLDQVCVRALARSPELRHPSASALADDLEAWLDHRPIAWQRPSPSRVVVLWIRRRPTVAALCGLAAMLCIAGVVSTVYYVRVISDKNEKLLNQNVAMKEALEILDEAERTLGPNAPGVTDPRAKGTMDILQRAVPVINRAVEATSHATSPRPPEEPPGGPPPKNP